MVWSAKHPRALPPVGPQFQLFALQATVELGTAIAKTLGIALAAHEEREFEDGEHKTRPLDLVRGGRLPRGL